MLEIKNMTVDIGGLKIVNDVSFRVDSGQWLMIAGPNGAGKSTIISAISQGVRYTGDVLFEGRNVKAIRPSELAKCFGVLTQNHAVGYSFTVAEVVNLGRYSYSRGVFSGRGENDTDKIDRALELTGLTALRDQSVLTLSGGELQRTFLAQLFAQDPKMLILDEPTNHLDLVYQREIFELICGWIKETGGSVVSVVHDLSLAKKYGTDAILVSGGRLIASGKTAEVLSRENLSSVYSMDVYDWMNTMLSQWKEE